MRIASLLAPPLCLLLPLLLLGACGPADGGYDTAPPADAPAGVSVEAPSVAAAPAWSGDFNLIGTEPFWGVEIRPAGLTLTGPDAKPVTTPNPGPTADGEAGVWTTPVFIVRLAKGECSDGMSDRTYPYVATVMLLGRGPDQGELKGCAAAQRDFSEARP